MLTLQQIKVINDALNAASISYDKKYHPDIPKQQNVTNLSGLPMFSINPLSNNGPSKRNYKAMATAKLQRCVRELESGNGDAYTRCVLAGYDPAADLNIAKAELTKRLLR